MEKIRDGDDYYRLLALSELRPTDEGSIDVLLRTIVAGSSEIEHYPRSIDYKCPNCSFEKSYGVLGCGTGQLKDWRDIPMKCICPACGINCYMQQEDKGQLRKVLMTEQGETNPIHLTGFIYGDDINKIQPGTRLNLNGVLRSRKKSMRDLTYHRFFDINRFRLTDEKPLLPTDDEINTFINMDKTKLITSFAPHIRNMYLIKEALLLCCLGGVEGETVRGDINALLIGDPSVAKTQLLKFVTKIIQKSDYVSGKSASGAGLFGGVDNLSDGTRIGKPGSVVLCNGGVACIDEMEKMNPADRTYAHEVMESQTFSLRKIGIDITWEVKVSIIGAANPKKSTWNPELTIKENLTLPDSLLSRFGLIFLIRDIPNKEDDLAIAEHIAKMRRGEITAELLPKDIKKFINYARTIKPIETPEASEILTKWWSELRNESQKEESIQIDFRTIEDLHRLTEAYARMDLSTTADVCHAKRAIKMLNDSLHTLGMNTPGEKNQSVLESMTKGEYFKFIFREPRTMVKACSLLCEKRWWTDLNAEKAIQDAHGKGILIESGGEYSWVS